MATTTLTPELAKHTTALASAIAQSQKVVAAKARIGLFYQNAEATDLFRRVNEYGEELRNKHLAGMPPSEEEIAKFDKLREDVVNNVLCRGFLEARQELDTLLSTVSQYLWLAIEKGSAPTDEEVAEAMAQQASATCSCGGHCDSCDGNCDCHGEGECSCGKHE